MSRYVFGNGVPSWNGVPMIGNYGPIPAGTGNYWFVDGYYGSDGNNGKSSLRPFATIGKAISVASPGDAVLVFARKMAKTDTDPTSYAETVTVNVPSLAIIGVSHGRTQGGLPQIKKGSGSTALMTITAPGCLVAGIGFNGASSTGGGILLTDDGGSTSSAFGTSIMNCHFKNCVGSTATNAATGGAIQWGAAGGAWQVLISGNRFYKNVGDIVLKGTSGSVPQDVAIINNEFSDSAASTDCNLYLAGGSGMIGLTIARNLFGAFPAIGSGSNATYAVLTGCTGTMSDNFFGCSGKTFGAAANVKVPTTVLMAGNYQEGGLIGRT